MRRVRVEAGRPYDVIIGAGAWNELVSSIPPGGTIAVISDMTVGDLYGERIISVLENAGFRTVEYRFPSGERSKNMAETARILEFLAKNSLTRSDRILALGGGICGDMAGFCAAVYQRGIEYIQLPTTLLAAVDSSVGGKTAVNLDAGKNLAGIFHQPSLVICDTDSLKTLSSHDFSNGMAEVVKCGVLCDDALFHLVAGGGNEDKLGEIIARCVAHKAAFVAADEHDKGVRQKLNLGHTIGHAIEKCSDYGISHGEAVAIGTVMITRSAERLGVCEVGTAEIIATALENNGLPTATGLSTDLLAEAIFYDKKRSGGTINLILPERIGQCRISPTAIERIPAILALSMEDTK